MVAAGVKRPQSRVAKQGQGLSPRVGVSGIGMVWRNEECAGWGGSVTRVSPRTDGDFTQMTPWPPAPMPLHLEVGGSNVPDDVPVAPWPLGRKLWPMSLLRVSLDTQVRIFLGL